MEPIILASTSPRRQEILRNLNLPFQVLSPIYVESIIEGMSPEDLAEFHAMKKVESIIRMSIKINMPWILGADTLIYNENKILGKPLNRDEAKKMLESFSGKTHQVITVICLFNASTQYIATRKNCNFVTFANLTDQEIERYLEGGEWQGVAGGYRIQGQASCFIKHIEGSYSGIMGLPIHDLYAILVEQDYNFS